MRKAIPREGIENVGIVEVSRASYYRIAVKSTDNEKAAVPHI